MNILNFVWKPVLEVKEKVRNIQLKLAKFMPFVQSAFKSKSFFRVLFVAKASYEKKNLIIPYKYLTFYFIRTNIEFNVFNLVSQYLYSDRFIKPKQLKRRFGKIERFPHLTFFSKKHIEWLDTIFQMKKSLYERVSPFYKLFYFQT